MSKGNMLLGMARGKVGDLVFARAFGKQIVRAKAQSVANPKTVGQNTQRAILATIAKSAAALTPIVDHSWANIAYGAESVRHFRKVNMGLLRQQYLAEGANPINLTAKGGTFVPNALKISEGNLPQFAFDVDHSDNPAFPMSDTPLLMGEDGYPVSAFKASYPYLQGGDQLTLVRVRKTSGSLLDGDAIFAVSYDRMVFAPNAFDDNDNMIIADDGIFNPELLDLTKTTDKKMLVVVNSGSGKWLGVPRTDGTNDDLYAVALILSRKVNGVWQRSTQYLNLCEFEDMSDNDVAIASYGATESITSATEYLNQAGESDADAGVKGPYMQITSSGGNAFAGKTVSVGDTYSMGTAEIATGEELVVGASAYGSDENPLVALEINGTNADGAYQDHATVRSNSASFTFNIGEDGNLAGSYTITALYKQGKAKATFALTHNGN